MIIAVLQISLMPNVVWITLFLKNFPGVAPPSPPTLYYCNVWLLLSYKCRLEHPISQKFSEGQGCAPLAPQLCIIVMSDYYCPTNFFNAKCRLKHIISQKFSGGLRLPPSLANQRSFAPATCRVRLRAQNRKNLIFKWITEPSLWSYEMII